MFFVMSMDKLNDYNDYICIKKIETTQVSCFDALKLVIVIHH